GGGRGGAAGGAGGGAGGGAAGGAVGGAGGPGGTRGVGGDARPHDLDDPGDRGDDGEDRPPPDGDPPPGGLLDRHRHQRRDDGAQLQTGDVGHADRGHVPGEVLLDQGRGDDVADPHPRQRDE